MTIMINNTEVLPGQIWLNRDGDKRLILSVTKPGPHPIVVCEDNGEVLYTKFPNGSTHGNKHSPTDLISLYTPPVTHELWAGLYLYNESSYRYNYLSKEYPAEHKGVTFVSIKKVTLTEGEIEKE